MTPALGRGGDNPTHQQACSSYSGASCWLQKEQAMFLGELTTVAVVNCRYQAEGWPHPSVSTRWLLPGLSIVQGTNPAQCTHSRQNRSLQHAGRKASPTHQYAQSNHGSATTGSHTQSTQGTPLEYLVMMTRVGLHYRAPQNLFYTIPLLSRPGDIADYLIHRNKHTELDKMKRQRNMGQRNEQNKITEKAKQKGDKQYA